MDGRGDYRSRLCTKSCTKRRLLGLHGARQIRGHQRRTPRSFGSCRRRRYWARQRVVTQNPPPARAYEFKSRLRPPCRPHPRCRTSRTWQERRPRLGRERSGTLARNSPMSDVRRRRFAVGDRLAKEHAMRVCEPESALIGRVLLLAVVLVGAPVSASNDGEGGVEVVDPAGRPIANAKVTWWDRAWESDVERINHSPTALWEWSGVTDERGRAFARELAIGPGRLEVEAPAALGGRCAGLTRRRWSGKRLGGPFASSCVCARLRGASCAGARLTVGELASKVPRLGRLVLVGHRLRTRTATQRPKLKRFPAWTGLSCSDWFCKARRPLWSSTRVTRSARWS